MTCLKEDQSDRRTTLTDKRKKHIGSKESSLQINRRIKESRKEVIGYKRSIHTSKSGGPQRKCGKVQVRQGDKRILPLSTNHSNYSRKRFWKAEASIPKIDIGLYNLRPRMKKAAESRPSRGQAQDQGGPVQSRNPDPTAKSTDTCSSSTRWSSQEQEQEQKPRSGRSSRQSSRRSRGAEQQQRQEMGGKSISRRTASLEVLVGDVSNKKKY
ncbi:hypothetical protein TNCV_4559051 [Trichonephila clavipes]|nr:hypothetical protein TNCV_4559051 [Trichonephila clavipes]